MLRSFYLCLNSIHGYWLGEVVLQPLIAGTQFLGQFKGYFQVSRGSNGGGGGEERSKRVKNCQSSKYDDQNLKTWEYVILVCLGQCVQFYGCQGVKIGSKVSETAHILKMMTNLVMCYFT